LNEKIKKFFTFVEDLRQRLFWSALIFAVAFVLGFFATGPVVKIFTKNFYIEGVTIATTSPFQITDLAVNLGIFFALLITIPIVIFQLYYFIFPGLNKKEKSLLISSVPLCILLFLIGFSFGSTILFSAFRFLAILNEGFGIKNIWSVTSYLSEIFTTSSLLGLLFEFPLVLTGLVKLKIITVKALKKKRRLAWFLVLIIVSILPPTDGLSLLAMSVPLILLYEITLFVNREKKYQTT
jgi:sec-independent protein translocase protein TatC